MWLFDRYTITSLFVICAIALLLAWVLGRRTSWSQRRVLWTAAVPVPGLAALLAIIVFIESVTSSAERCGIDACGMAALAAFMLLALGGIGFILAAITARIGYWISKR